MSKLCAFTVYDENNRKYADILAKSWAKFCPDVELKHYSPDIIDPLIKSDNQFFYRATPIIMKQLMDEGYTHVGKIDADSIVLGNLDYIFKSEYEVGTVLNWNRVDPQKFGLVGFATIAPQEYVNNGLVFTRSKEFVQEWLDLCFSPHFDKCPMREQDLLNILIHYGRFVTRIFDYPADDNEMDNSWYGLISKGEWMRTIVKKGFVVIPKGEGDNPFPSEDTKIRLIHFAEGKTPNKANYRTKFPEKVSDFIDGVIK